MSQRVINNASLIASPLRAITFFPSRTIIITVNSSASLCTIKIIAARWATTRSIAFPAASDYKRAAQCTSPASSPCALSLSLSLFLVLCARGEKRRVFKVPRALPRIQIDRKPFAKSIYSAARQ